MNTLKGERKIAILWLVNLVLITLLTTAQIVGKKYTTEGGVFVMIWIAFMFIPPMVVIFASIYSRNFFKNSHLIIHPKYFKISRLSSILYLIIFWCIVLSHPFFSVPPITLYAWSSFLLIPLQIFILLNLCLMLATRKEILT